MLAVCDAHHSPARPLRNAALPRRDAHQSSAEEDKFRGTCKHPLNLRSLDVIEIQEDLFMLRNNIRDTSSAQKQQHNSSQHIGPLVFSQSARIY